MSVLRILLPLTAATLAFAASPVGSAPWTAFTPSFSIQQCAGGTVSGDVFSLPKSADGSTTGSGCSNGHMRAERRYTDDYSTGVVQFGGEFTITSFTGNNICLKQTFNGAVGDFFLLAVNNKGDLYMVGGSTIASGVATVGTTVRINTVHDTSSKTLYVYVNGKESLTVTAPGGSFYDKCGTYATDTGSGTISVTWSDVQFWNATSFSTATTTTTTTSAHTTTSTSSTPVNTDVCSYAGGCEGDPCPSVGCADQRVCVSGLCTSNTCSEPGHCEGAPCTSSTDCTTGMHCDGGLCTTGSCDWAGHCEGAGCANNNGCGDPTYCNASAGICTTGCSWIGHCVGAACVSNDDCANTCVDNLCT